MSSHTHSRGWSESSLTSTSGDEQSCTSSDGISWSTTVGITHSFGTTEIYFDMRPDSVTDELSEDLNTARKFREALNQRDADNEGESNNEST